MIFQNATYFRPRPMKQYPLISLGNCQDVTNFFSCESIDVAHCKDQPLGFRQQLGLSTGSLIAFLIGMVCVLSAVSMGIIFTVQTTLDWQALQLWRMEWLLGALVSFVAGILLKKSVS